MSFSDPLFKVPFSNSGEIYVRPYNAFADGFCVAFSDENAIITVQQKPKETTFDSPPDHSFSLDIEFRDIKNTKWVTLEGNVDIKNILTNRFVTALISMRSTTRSHAILDLRIRRYDGSYKDTRIGSVTTVKDDEYHRSTISANLQGVSDILDDNAEKATLLLFLPVENKQFFSLSMFNVFFTKGGF